MKQKRIIKILIIMLISLLAIVGLATKTYAAKDNYVLAIQHLRENGGAYIIDGTGASTVKKIWKIVSYPNLASTTVDYSNAFYCLRAEHGFANTSTSASGKKEYRIKLDMKSQKTEVLPRLVATNACTDYNSTTKESETYNKIMWILDHMYVKNSPNAQAQKNELLKKIPDINIANTPMTDEDIEVIQQLAIWYFTNQNSDYSSTDTINRLKFNNNSGSAEVPNSFKSFADWYKEPYGGETSSETVGQARQYDCKLLYEYLITEANKQGRYTSPNSDVSPLTLDKSRVALTEEGSNYLIGPFRINRNSNIAYTLNTLAFTDGAGQEFNYTLLNGNKQVISGAKIGEDFYVCLPDTTTVRTIKFDMNLSYTKTIATYYTTDDATYRGEQPVVLVEKQPATYTDNVTIQIGEKPFDLSLRKFISEINGVAIPVSRAPQVDVSGLKAGVATTATYNHPKAPLEVPEEATITYTIRVYNEGQKDGYASEITDHLPPELEFLPNDNQNQAYGWSYDNTDPNRRTIKTNYLSKARNENNILRAYNGGDTLDYKELKVRCKLKPSTQEGKRIVNIADITEFTDANGNGITDRDSQAKNVTIPADGNLPNYKQTEINRGDRYIPGQQDDDDFDSIYIRIKLFDLSLRKFISEVNGVATKVSREPQVDVSGLKAGVATTATYNHTKIPLSVPEEAIITYTIRVYNEGQKDGYASEITDHLPPELEFLPNDSQNKSYGWSYDNTDASKRTIKTNYLSKATNENNILRAYNGGNSLDYKDLKVRCKLKPSTQEGKRIVNIADITGFTDTNGNTITDRDSQAKNVTLPTDQDLPNYKLTEINRGDKYIPGQQDDDDFDNIYIKIKPFDLALRKFITKINGVAPQTSREPVVDISGLKSGTATTAIYNHPKAPLSVEIGDIVTYTIRVYNEGQKDGYASEITDHLPPELEFLPEDEENIANGWVYDDKDTSLRTIKTAHLSKQTDSENLIKAFDGERLDYKDLTVKCKVVTVPSNTKRIVNIADITAFTDANGNPITDRDSQANNIQLPSDEQLPNYKQEEIDQKTPYIPGQQDDDDFDSVRITYFDLALRKFISVVNGKVPTVSREPVVDISGLKSGTATTAIYNHPKVPLQVKVGDIVTYTIRVYNEGKKDGYASEITDHLPEQLEFLPEDETNIANGWKYDENDSSHRTIKTNRLSKEVSENNLIKAFDGETLYYKDITVNCKVTGNPKYNKRIVNIADITDFTDEKGNEIKDIDSEKNNVKVPEDENLPNYKQEEIDKGDKYIPGQQDDDDFDSVTIVYFDLALRKFITKVDSLDINNRYPQLSMGEDGNIKYTHTKEPVLVANGNIVTYTIRIYNEGTMAGYASEITDDLPEGLVFLPQNDTNVEYRWKMLDKDGKQTDDVKQAVKITTDYLSKAQEKEKNANLLKPFDEKAGLSETNPDHRDVKIAFKVTEPNTSDRILINTAEISEDADENDDPVDDIDSTPGNNKEGEDDIDIDKVRVKYFDLALKKWVTQAIVIQDGNQTIIETRTYRK